MTCFQARRHRTHPNADLLASRLHLSLLEKKGLIRRDWNQKRGVEVVDNARETPPAAGVRELPLFGYIAAGQPLRGDFSHAGWLRSQKWLAGVNHEPPVARRPSPVARRPSRAVSGRLDCINI